MTKLLAARINPWIDFKIRKLAQENNYQLGVQLEIALSSYLNSLDIPQQKIEEWLKEYKKNETEKNEMD
jgi:hypothetical protein